MLYPAVRPILFALDPERAHRLTLEALRVAGHLPGPHVHGAAVDLMGLHFPNRVGLAAGFDKNAEAIDGIGRLGFGFIEIGTVTPRPQPGQPRPRVFRLPQHGALINRMGFPSEGANAVAARLRQRRRYRGILGINIGKNADTPLDRAIDDYVSCLRTLHSFADYVAVNISSPNTASLRDLHAPERLTPFVTALLSERDALLRGTTRRLPLLLKVSPDLDAASLASLAEVALRVSLDGIIATNTTVTRDALGTNDPQQAGGLSGAPLHPLSLRIVRELRRLLGPTFPIIGVGGIDSPATALAMRRAGADLIQLYTGMVYRGPGIVRRCVRALAADR
ncbi:MAG TPA: quinone-dependent dihydroorotate dehydrogenase [Steroidobacteraceae bacterium]|jgi:dihydroorotate dehydrogenase|nr:quinone-dependent dihydroorotate dehydrogenase [Steroidobacteraceae bacterium]